MTVKRSKKSQLVSRRVVGVRLITGKVPPYAYAIYEEHWLEGQCYTTKIAYGSRVRTSLGFSDLNPRNKKERKLNKEELRFDLYIPILSASLLMNEIETACVKLDSKRGLKET